MKGSPDGIEKAARLYRAEKSVYGIGMKPIDRPQMVFLGALILYAALALAGASQVPFHPDESTHIFMSADGERFWRDPSELFWQPGREEDPLTRYRLIDAPLTRNLIAFGRWVAGEPALPVDWNWSASYEENRAQGALPSDRLLRAARLTVTALLPLSVLFLYLTAKRVSGERAGWAAALLLASSALALLHARRAMAEGPLLFAAAFSLWVLARAEERPWLNSLPAALAFSAKQSLLPLSLVGGLAALWPIRPETSEAGRGRWARSIRSGLLFCVITAGLVFALHPSFWRQPVEAIFASIDARQALISAQSADRPGQSLDTPARKLIAMTGALYFTPPIFAETSNYVEQTRESEIAYLANPLNWLLREPLSGAVLLGLNLFGFFTAARRAISRREPVADRRRLALLITANLFQAAALLVMIHLPWQRYYLPLVPFSCLWVGVGIDGLIRLGRAFFGARGPARRAAHLQGM
jgi:hypothetical protein